MTSRYAAGNVITFVVVLFAGVLAHFRQAVECIDVIAYDNAIQCIGIGTACLDLQPRICCLMAPPRPTLGFTWLDAGFTITAYTGENCPGPAIFSSVGEGNRCLTGLGSFQSSMYAPNSAATLSGAGGSVQQPEHSQASCNSTVFPDGVVFTFPDASKETWILKTGSNKLKDVFDELYGTPDHQKMTWLQRAGATVQKTPGSLDPSYDHF